MSEISVTATAPRPVLDRGKMTQTCPGLECRGPIRRDLFSALRSIISGVHQRTCQGFLPILAPQDDSHDLVKVH
jgi:hypothetical protein